MGILLAILKIIGIILLVILLLILLIMILVLFSPIHYRLGANHDETNTDALARIRFLCVNGNASFVKGTGLSYAVKILFFPIFSSDKENKKGKSGKNEAELIEEDNLEPYLNQLSEEEEANEAAEVSSSDLGSDINTVEGSSPDNISEVSDSASSESTEGIESTPDISSGDSGISSEVEEEKKTPGEIIEDSIEKVDDKIAAIDTKIEKATVKINHISQFLDKPYVKRTFGRIKKVIVRLLMTIKPKKSSGYLKMGLGSSASTGEVLGKASMFYPLYGRWLTIEPDFYNKVIEGNIDIRGRMYLFRFVFPALRIIISRDFWRTKKLAEKI